MPKDLASVLNEPSFGNLSPEVQRAVLGKMGVTKDNTEKILQHLSKGSQAARAYDAYLKSSQPTSVEREPGKGQPATFMTRVSKEVARNLRPVGHPMEFAAQVSQEIEAGKKRTRAENIELIKKDLRSYLDPAKLVATGISGLILGELGGVSRTGLREGAFQPETAPEAPPWWRRTRRATGEQLPPAVSEAPTLTPEQVDKWRTDLDKANREHAQALADHAEKEGRRRGKWVRDAYGAGKSEADAIAAGNQKEMLDRSSMEYARRVQQNIRDTHQTVRARLDSRWNDFRANMHGATVPKSEVFDIVTEARDRLRGSPSDLKQFTDLVREMGIEVNEEGEITIPEGVDADMPVDTARVHSTAIGDRLAAGDLPGQVYQALKESKLGIEGLIEDAAEARGQGPIYRQLKADWSRYMRDWNDMRTVSTGKGSPLARALRAPNAALLRPLLSGGSGDILLERLGGYRDAGARPELATHARSLAARSRAIKAPRVRPMPAEYEPSPTPQLKEVPPPSPKPIKVTKGGEVHVPRALKIGAKIAGKVTGGLAGSALGHPIVGYVAGGEIAPAILEKIYAGRGEVPTTPAAVPESLRLPETKEVP